MEEETKRWKEWINELGGPSFGKSSLDWIFHDNDSCLKLISSLMDSISSKNIIQSNQLQEFEELKERKETIQDVKLLNKMMEKMEWKGEEKDFISIEKELEEMERERNELEDDLEGLLFRRDQFYSLYSNKEQQRVQWEKSTHGKEYNNILSQKRKLEQQNEEWKKINHQMSLQSSILSNWQLQKKEDDGSGLLSLKQLNRYEMENNALLRNLKQFFQKQFKVQDPNSTPSGDVFQDLFCENEHEMRRIRKMFKNSEMSHIKAEMEWIGLTTFSETVRTQHLDAQNGLFKDLMSLNDSSKGVSPLSSQNDQNLLEINKLLSTTIPSLFTELAQLQNISVLEGDYQLKRKKLQSHLEKRKEFLKFLFNQLSSHRMCLFSISEESRLIHEDLESLEKNLQTISTIIEDFLTHNCAIHEFSQNNSNRQEILSLCSQISHQTSTFLSPESNIQKFMTKLEENENLAAAFEREQSTFLNSLIQSMSNIQSQLMRTPLSSSMKTNVWNNFHKNNTTDHKNANLIEHTHQRLDQMLKDFSSIIVDIINKRDSKIEQNESLERRTKLALMVHFFTKT